MNYNTFSCEPKITINPKDTKKPFVLLNDIYYCSAKHHGKDIYGIWINKGYNWNGANIPRFLWRVVGSRFNPEFLPASMVHDWLCEHKDFILQDGVKISSEIFRDILELYGVPKIKSNIMAASVRVYQFFQKGWN